MITFRTTVPEPTFAVFELDWLGFASENRTVCGEGTKTREELEMHTPACRGGVPCDRTGYIESS